MRWRASFVAALLFVASSAVAQSITPPSLPTLTFPVLAGPQAAVIYKGATPYWHYYYDPTTDGYNQFWGENAGNFTLAGMGLGPGSASYNICGGSQCLHNIKTSYFTAGWGIEVLSELETGHNIFAGGSKSGFHLKDGSYDTFVGDQNSVACVHCNRVTSIGHKGLEFNLADENTCTGYECLWGNISGTRNTGDGLHTGYTDIPANANVSGNDNYWAGYQAGPGTPTQLNGTVVIGFKAKAYQSNQAVFGGDNITETVLKGNVLAPTLQVGNGFTGSGSTCTITAVDHGVITAAVCVP